MRFLNLSTRACQAFSSPFKHAWTKWAFGNRRPLESGVFVRALIIGSGRIPPGGRRAPPHSKAYSRSSWRAENFPNLSLLQPGHEDSQGKSGADSPQPIAGLDRTVAFYPGI